MNLLVFWCIGRLIIWLCSVAKPTQRLWKAFGQCDLCLGFWMFWIAALVSNVQVYCLVLPSVWILDLGWVVSSFVTAIISTFVVHVFVLGWKAKFYAYTTG